MTTRVSILSSCLYRISIGIVFLLVLCTRCYADNTDAYIKELTDIVSEVVLVCRYISVTAIFGILMWAAVEAMVGKQDQNSYFGVIKAIVILIIVLIITSLIDLIIWIVLDGGLETIGTKDINYSDIVNRAAHTLQYIGVFIGAIGLMWAGWLHFSGSNEHQKYAILKGSVMLIVILIAPSIMSYLVALLSDSTTGDIIRTNLTSSPTSQ